MSQEKVDFYKDKKAKRKEEIAKANKKKFGKKVRDVICILIFVGIAVGVVVSIANMVGTYSDSLPEYKATEFVLNDYAAVATTESDLSDIVSGDGIVSIDDEGQVEVASEVAETVAEAVSEAVSQ